MMNPIEVTPDVLQSKRRRRHSQEFKAEVIAAALQPNVSIAAVALHYRLNANMVRTWIANREAQALCKDSATAPTPLAVASMTNFISLPIDPEATPTACDIVIEIRRGESVVSVRWPLSASSDCAAWLQGWLK